MSNTPGQELNPKQIESIRIVDEAFKDLSIYGNLVDMDEARVAMIKQLRSRPTPVSVEGLRETVLKIADEIRDEGVSVACEMDELVERIDYYINSLTPHPNSSEVVAQSTANAQSHPDTPEPSGEEEYIKHAAILFNGIIYVGRDHARIINEVMTPMGINELFIGGSTHEQGFVTNLGRYVDREEGREIAIRAHQVNEADLRSDLFSEDLNYPPSKDGLPFRTEWNWIYKPKDPVSPPKTSCVGKDFDFGSDELTCTNPNCHEQGACVGSSKTEGDYKCEGCGCDTDMIQPYCHQCEHESIVKNEVRKALEEVRKHMKDSLPRKCMNHPISGDPIFEDKQAQAIYDKITEIQAEGAESTQLQSESQFKPTAQNKSKAE